MVGWDAFTQSSGIKFGKTKLKGSFSRLWVFLGPKRKTVVWARIDSEWFCAKKQTFWGRRPKLVQGFLRLPLKSPAASLPQQSGGKKHQRASAEAKEGTQKGEYQCGCWGKCLWTNYHSNLLNVLSGEMKTKMRKTVYARLWESWMTGVVKGKLKSLVPRINKMKPVF